MALDIIVIFYALGVFMCDTLSYLQYGILWLSFTSVIHFPDCGAVYYIHFSHFGCVYLSYSFLSVVLHIT